MRSFNLLDLLASTGLWAEELIAKHLDPTSRIALFQSSAEGQQQVLQAAEHLTVTLLAYGGLSEAAWQKRLASAERALAVRGPQRNTKLVLRLPTPNPAALHSILSMSEAAGRAVTELEVHQSPSTAALTEGVHTPWLQALPAAFPNLRTLRINRLCGCLPASAQLPHLRELHVTLCAAGESTISQQCQSIAPYLAQLTALDISIRGIGWKLSWSEILTTVTTSLVSLKATVRLSDQLVESIVKFAPNLETLGCDFLTGRLG